MTKFIPFLIKLLLSALDKSVVEHSAQADSHQKAANAHQTAAEQSSKLLVALTNVLG